MHNGRFICSKIYASYVIRHVNRQSRCHIDETPEVEFCELPPAESFCPKCHNCYSARDPTGTGSSSFLALFLSFVVLISHSNELLLRRRYGGGVDASVAYDGAQ
jgi:hypothetical protein